VRYSLFAFQKNEGGCSLPSLYLIRHAQPYREVRHSCGYKKDVPLSPVGEHQAKLLGEWAKERNLSAIYTSPLLRTVQTSNALSGGSFPVFTLPGLEETNTGAWTGLTFDKIRRQWPTEYEERGKHPGILAPPGGESFAQAAIRMERALTPLMIRAKKDLAVVAHGGISRGWLCSLMGLHPDQALRLPQPWGGITKVRLGEGRPKVIYMGRQPCPYPDEVLVQDLWQRYETPSHVRAHGRAVANCALELARQSYASVNLGLLEASCLLHDMVRSRSDHAEAGAKILAHEGYPQVSTIVATHHNLPDDASVEAVLLYLADKLVLGTDRVTLSQRFGAKQNRCRTPEALDAWTSRYYRAQQAARQLQLIVS